MHRKASPPIAIPFFNVNPKNVIKLIEPVYIFSSQQSAFFEDLELVILTSGTRHFAKTNLPTETVIEREEDLLDDEEVVLEKGELDEEAVAHTSRAFLQLIRFRGMSRRGERTW